MRTQSSKLQNQRTKSGSPNETQIPFIRCMEKEIGAICPSCGLLNLNVYFERGNDSPLGAKCDSCGLTGFFMKEELVPLTSV